MEPILGCTASRSIQETQVTQFSEPQPAFRTAVRGQRHSQLGDEEQGVPRGATRVPPGPYYPPDPSYLALVHVFTQVLSKVD